MGREWLREEVGDTKCENELTSGSVNASPNKWMWEADWVGIFEWVVSHKVSEFAMVKLYTAERRHWPHSTGCNRVT